MADIHPQDTSLLFGLPTEIRERIQRFALTENDLLTGTVPVEIADAIVRVQSGTLPPVMRTCKRMYLEMRPFAFTEMILHYKGPATSRTKRIGVLAHGNLRHEHVRRISMVVDDPTSKSFRWPKWYYFLRPLLVRCTEVDQLDFEFGENLFRTVVEAELGQLGEETIHDDTVVRHFPLPSWLQDVARNPSLRRVCFEGNMPPVWLKGLRQQSEGRIQIFSDGVRFMEKEVPLESVAGVEDPLSVKKEEVEVGDPRIHFVYEGASRFDQA